MWSRVVELMLGCWLLMSPFIFGHPASEVAWWVTDFAAGLGIIALALLSYWNRAQHAHLVTAIVGGALIGMAYRYCGESTPAAIQNQAILGLLLLMFAVIPNQASQPPPSWKPHANSFFSARNVGISTLDRSRTGADDE